MKKRLPTKRLSLPKRPVKPALPEQPAKPVGLRMHPDIAWESEQGRYITPEEAWRMYAPPRTLGATKQHQLAMDAHLRECGFHSLLTHAVNLGMGFEEMAPQFLGYPYLAGLSQNGLIRAGVTTVAEEMTKRWIEIRRVGGADEPSARNTAGNPGQQSGHDPARRTRASALSRAEREGFEPRFTRGDETSAIASVAQDVRPSGICNDRIKTLTTAMEDFGIQSLFNEAAQKCDFDGGCLIFIDTGDADDVLENRLYMDSLLVKGRVKRFTLVEAVNLYPGPYNAVDPLSPGYFDPDTWMVMGKRIHASRFLYFAPNRLSMLLRPSYNFFGIPAAQLALDYVAHFTSCREAAQRLLTKFSLTVFKSDMAQILSGGSAQHMDLRLRYLAQKRDNDSILLVDKEREDVVKLETPLGGTTEIVRQSLEFLAAIFRIPFVKFLGISPGGLNATGEADLRNFYDHVGSKQEKILREPLNRVLDILQLHLFGDIDPELKAVFVPLCDEDGSQRAGTLKTEADRDAVYLDKGVLDRAEVRRKLSDTPESGYGFIDAEDLPKGRQDGGTSAISKEEDTFGAATPDAVEPTARRKPREETVNAAHDANPGSDWKEEDHPRDDDGKFKASGGTSSGGIKAEKLIAENKDIVARSNGASSESIKMQSPNLFKKMEEASSHLSEEVTAHVQNIRSYDKIDSHREQTQREQSMKDSSLQWKMATVPGSPAARVNSESWRKVKRDLKSQKKLDEYKTYTARAFNEIGKARKEILKAAEEYGLPWEAIAGALLDEYSVRNDWLWTRGGFDWLQDRFIKFKSFKTLSNSSSLEKSPIPFYSAGYYDVGPGNIKIKTAISIFEDIESGKDKTSPLARYASSFMKHNVEGDEAVREENWKKFYNHIVMEPAGSAYFAAHYMHQGMIEMAPYIKSANSLQEQAAILMTWYKQGPSYLKRYLESGREKSRPIRPGEGLGIAKNWPTMEKVILNGITYDE